MDSYSWVRLIKIKINIQSAVLIFCLFCYIWFCISNSISFLFFFRRVKLGKKVKPHDYHMYLLPKKKRKMKEIGGKKRKRKIKMVACVRFSLTCWIYVFFRYWFKPSFCLLLEFVMLYFRESPVACDTMFLGVL